MRGDGRVECGGCGRVVSLSNISRHRGVCRALEVAVAEEEEEEELGFVGFEEEDRGRPLHWFEGFGEGDRGRGLNAEMNGEEREEEEEEEMNVRENVREIVGVQRRENVGALGRVDGGRVFRGRRRICSLCGASISSANMARHERTHRVWDPGGGPYPN